MCGIAGFYSHGLTGAETILSTMLTRIFSRGPDEEGREISGNLALGMRRLSIIDLAGGHQPIANEDGTLRVVFNGEIYNFAVLRTRLEAQGHRFSTHSDTEVLVHLYEEYGVEMVQHLEGMFAFCLYDEPANKLFLARDPAGKKPLFYFMDEHHFVFASEVKSLLAHPAIPRVVEPSALALYLTHGYVPAMGSLVQGVRKLPGGYHLTVDLAQWQAFPVGYWDLDFSRKNHLTEAQTVQELETRLEQAVVKRLVAEVPLGIFLSGGVDSSLLVALMARHVPGKRIRSFSIGFREQAYDESAYALQVAEQFGTDHVAKIFDVEELFGVMDEILEQLDEPNADPSILPTYLLTRTTRAHGIVVALSGDGGDEMFGGYPKYYIHRYARFYDALPKIVREQVVEPLFRAIPLRPENKIFNYKVERFLASARYQPHHRNQFWVAPFAPDELPSVLSNTSEAMLQTLLAPAERLSAAFNGTDLVDRMLYLDTKLMMQEMYLTKVDRTSMATSLEVRSPFLDRQVMEFAATIPSSMKVRGRQTKYILKQLAQKHLPHSVVFRFKKGFGMPLAFWIKRLASDIRARIDRHPSEWIRKQAVHQLLDEHMSGARDNTSKLWPLYVYLRWHERWME